MDIVFVEQLKISATIGVWEWEQRIKQTLVIDLELGTDIGKCAASDDIKDALSYKAVSMRVVELISNGKFNLIESVAETVAKTILKEFSVEWCKVRVSKPRAVEKSANVGVVIERTGADYAS